MKTTFETLIEDQINKINLYNASNKDTCSSVDSSNVDCNISKIKNEQ